MSRRFMDGSLRHWEAFASTGWQGVSRPALLVFQSEDGLRPRAIEKDRSRADVEADMERMSDEELRELVEAAEPFK